MKARFNRIGTAGINRDIPPWELPAETWSDGRNFKFHDTAAENIGGHSAVFGTPLGAGYKLFPVRSASEYFWVYAGFSGAWATDGSVHANIGTMTAGSIINGGAFQSFLVLNNGAGTPKTWTPNLAVDMVNLANWEVGLTADIIRPFKNYLFALRCQESGLYNPRLLRHSNGATAGSLPSTWDYTDPNEDTGRVEFGQTTDRLVDAVPLRDNLVIYKQNHTWAAQYVGGVDNPFIYRQVFSQIGSLTQDCATPFEGKHLVLSTDDVVIHDLNSVQSIVDKRTRNWLFNAIDPTYYLNCFTVPNYREREIWVCFPSSGAQYPDTAMVWNWAENTIAIRDIGFECPHMNWGVVNTTAGTTFDEDVGTFNEAVGAFDGLAFNPSTTSILMTNPSAVKLYQVDESGTFDGTAITKTLTREALPFDDFLRWKRIYRVFPKLIGVAGETVDIYIGTRETFEDDVDWAAPETFTIGSSVFVNFRKTGRIIDIRFEYSGNQKLRLHGYDIEWEPDGLC